MNGEGNSGFGWVLVVLGFSLALLGLIWVVAPHLPRPGRLPGDLVVERGNSRVYFPIVTSIVLSIVLSLVLNVILWVLRSRAQ